MVQFGVVRGTPVTVRTSVTSVPASITFSPVPVTNVASNTRPGSFATVALRHSFPPSAPATHAPAAAPSASAPESSRMQHTSPISSPSGSASSAESSRNRTRHRFASAVASSDAERYDAHAPAASSPVTGSKPRSRQSYPLEPHVAPSESRHVSAQQSPPSKHGAKFSAASHVPSPTRASSKTPTQGFAGTEGRSTTSVASAGTTRSSGTRNTWPRESVNRTRGFETYRESSSPTNHVAFSPSLSVGAQSPPRSPSPSTARSAGAASCESLTRGRHLRVVARPARGSAVGRVGRAARAAVRPHEVLRALVLRDVPHPGVAVEVGQRGFGRVERRLGEALAPGRRSSSRRTASTRRAVRDREVHEIRRVERLHREAGVRIDARVRLAPGRGLRYSWTASRRGASRRTVTADQGDVRRPAAAGAISPSRGAIAAVRQPPRSTSRCASPSWAR